MAKGRACKVCTLKKKKPAIYKKISDQIIKNEKGTMAKFLRDLNKEHCLDISPMNVHRHKPHILDGNKKGNLLSQEIEVYSEESEQSYSTIPEVIDNLKPEHKLFCEEYVNSTNLNATAAYMKVYGTGPTGATMVSASRLLRNAKVAVYIQYLNQERSEALGISSHYVLTHLMTIVERCMEAEPVLDKNGEETGEYNFNASGAIMALKLLAKHLGMFDKKSEAQKNPYVYKNILEKFSSNELDAFKAGIELAKHQMELPEVLKIAIMKMDLSDVNKPPIPESEDLDNLTDEELDRLIAQAEAVD